MRSMRDTFYQFLAVTIVNLFFINALGEITLNDEREVIKRRPSEKMKRLQNGRGDKDVSYRLITLF